MLAITAAAVAATTLLVLAVLHLPPVRARILRFAIDQAAAAGVVLKADRLSYNLLAGTASLTNVSVAARGAESEPLFTAARVAIDVPLAAYMGSIIIDDLVVEDGRIQILTAADGRSNLPVAEPAAEPPVEAAGEPLAVAVRGLHLRNVDVVFDDGTVPLSLAATGIDAALEHRVIQVFDGATGPFAVRGGIDLRFGDIGIRVEPIDSRLAFDGSTLSLQDLPLATNVGALSVSGRVTDLLGTLGLELTFDGQLRLDQVATLVPVPIPLDGTTGVKGSITGPASAIETVVRFDAASLTVGAERDLQVSGEVLVDAERVSVNRLLVSPAGGGQLDAALDLPLGDAPLTAEASWKALDARVLFRLGNVAEQPIGATLAGRARYTAGPRTTLALDLGLDGIASRGLTPVDGRVTAEVGNGRWMLAHDLRTSGASTSGKAEGAFDETAPERSTLTGATRLVVANLAALDRDLAPLGTRVPEALGEATGAIETTAVLAGTIGAPRAVVDVSAPAFEVPGVGAAAIALRAEASPERVDVSSLRLSRGTAEVTGAVAIDLAGGALSGEVRATVPDLEELQAATPEGSRVAGSLYARVTLGGTLDAPVAEATVSSPSLAYGGETFTMLEGALGFADDTVTIPALGIRKGDGRVNVTGRYGLDGTYAVDLDVAELDWSGAVVGDADSRVTLNGGFAGDGTVARPTGKGQFRVGVTGGVAGDVIGTGTVDVLLNGDEGRVSALVPALGAFANGSVSLTAPYAYRGTAVISELDLGRLSALAGAVPDAVSGALSLTAAIGGEAAGERPPRAEVRLDELSAEIAGVPLLLASPAAATWQPGEVSVREFTVAFGAGILMAHGEFADRANTVFGGRFDGELADLLKAATAFGVDPGVTASGRLGAEVVATANRGDLIAAVSLENAVVEAGDGISLKDLRVDAGITGERLTLHALSGHLAAVQASGDFTVTGAATLPELDPRRADGRFVIDSATFDAAGVDVAQVRPSVISVKDGVLSLDDMAWEAAGSTLTVGGRIDASGETPALDLSLAGVAVLRVLSAFAPEVAIDGTADVDVKVAGTFDAPALSGGVTLKDVEVALSEPRFVISGLSGPIVLSGNRVELRGLTGSANDGLLTIDGGVVLEGTTIADGDFYVQASGVAVEFPEGLRSEIDALLTYDMGEDTPLLSGDVRIQRSSFTEAISLAALARQGTSTTTVQATGGESALDNLRLNITVTTVTDMRVDNNYGDFNAGAQLRIVGTAANPGMSGQVALREGGTIRAAGRTFTITRGTVSFTNLNRIEPDLDIQAVARVSQQGDVTLTLSGTPDEFEFELSSEEGGSQEEIATALFGGNVTGANAVTLLSSDLLGVTGQQLGLDSLRIDRGDVVRDEFREDPSALLQDDRNPVTRLTLSKRLSEEVEFTVSQNLAQSGKATFIVSYFPITNLELRAISRDDSSFGVGLRHQITLGGRTVARDVVERPAVPVTAVRFEGELSPLREDELRGRLRLRQGERFDYLTWQADRERLTDEYLSRNHFEVRVRATRADTTDGGVSLLYEVTPGPVTRIEVEGIEAPADDLAAIRRLWGNAVFDRFVIQDAEARFERHLVASGFIEGTVEASMEDAPAAKTLRVRVTPGPPSDERTIRFSGNAEIGDNELRALVVQRGLGVEAWLRPSDLADALDAYYRSQGFFGADVQVGRPSLDGRLAVLPVTIDEGARATIAGVAWSGVSDERLETMQETADLAAGTEYTLGAIDAARSRVERRYRGLGFNNVRVASTATPVDDGARVELALKVEEGPQQILREIETEGATRTREGVVDRALRLRIGEPVNLEEWSLARKRLFDTNVFRSVEVQPVPLTTPVDGVQPVRALVTVEEYPPWRFRYGFQVDRENEIGTADEERVNYSPGILGELRNQNLFGRALTGGVATLLETNFQRVNTFLQTPSFFGLPARSSVFLFGSTEDVKFEGETLFIEDNVGVSFEQRYRRRRGFEITYGYRFQRGRVYDPAPDPLDQFPLDVVTNLGWVTSAFLLDRRDDPVNATAGTFTSVSYQLTTPTLGADVSYSRVLAQQYNFQSLGRVVLASRVVAGSAFGRDEPVGFSERFLAGGGTTVRGYPENGLGPRDVVFNEPYGGTSLLILNQEVRFPIYRWVRGVGFLDVGNAFAPEEPFAVGNLKAGYGGGLRIDSPVGLLRVDFGIPTSTIRGSTRRANTVGAGRWYFGIGHVF